MNWGLRNRLDRVLPGLPNGTGSVMFAIDHGYFMGPTSGLEDPRKTIVPLLLHADSLMLTRGILQNSIPKRTNIPIVLRVSSGNSILNEDLSNEKLCVSIEDAISFVMFSSSCLFPFISAVLTSIKPLFEFFKTGERRTPLWYSCFGCHCSGQRYEPRPTLSIFGIAHCCGIRR